jgi:hypothetical protein
LAGTAVMFVITLVFLAIAGATHDVWPIFVGSIPLLLVPWLLTRPEADGAAVGTGRSPADEDEDEDEDEDRDVTPAMPSPADGAS